ncbi:TetR/AcrR family transcriptional regulator [Leeia sp.]|uniref:TetR/AcrR family transcriptional regulator n=1 Tax=Leeia sp. TaxID=2884678 RepID=UPI0035AE0B6A
MSLSQQRRAAERAALEHTILQAARQLLVEYGVEGMTLRKLASVIGYAPATVYSYFADKDALLYRLVLDDFSELSAEMAALLPLSDPVKRLREMLLVYARFGLRHPHAYRLMFMQPLPVASQHFAERKDKPGRDGYAALRLALAEAQGIPGEATPALELATQSLWAGIHGVVSLELALRHDDWVAWQAVEARIGQMIDLLLNGLLSSRSAS